MKLVAPELAYKEKAKDYIREFANRHCSIEGTGQQDALLVLRDYETWLEMAAMQADTSIKIPGQVDASSFFYIREEDDQIVGMVNIRYGLNAHLYNEGGHVGFSVRPSEWGRGIATELLQDALLFCRLIGLDKVLVICDKNNRASATVIKKCGGVLENEVQNEKGGVNQRYWIENKGGLPCIF